MTSKKTSIGQVEASYRKKFVKVRAHICFELMWNKEKSSHIIEFSVKKADLESLSDKFLSCEIYKGYKIVLVSNGSTVGVDEIPVQNGYDNAIKVIQTLIKNVKFTNDPMRIWFCPSRAIFQWEG